jgi:hypothetical protein
MKESMENKILILISLAFVVIGLFLISSDGSLAGVAGTLFFGACLIVFIFREFESRFVFSLSQIRERSLKADEIEVPRSKTKTIVVLIGAAGFIVAGGAMVFVPETFGNAMLSRLIGIVGISFFGVCGIYAVRKLFDRTPGLIIHKNGITDNSAASSVGFIDWKDIKEISTWEVASTRFLVLNTNVPSKYIDRAENAVTQKLMKANYKMCGSPITIAATSLKIKFDDLKKLVSVEFKKHKQRKR